MSLSMYYIMNCYYRCYTLIDKYENHRAIILHVGANENAILSKSPLYSNTERIVALVYLQTLIFNKKL